MEIHIGKIIEQKFQESGIKLSVFAERINTGERNVYSIFKRKDINAGMLKDISEVLDFNFFSLYVPNTQMDEREDKGSFMTIHLDVEVPKKNLDRLPKFLNQLGELGVSFGFTLL